LPIRFDAHAYQFPDAPPPPKLPPPPLNPPPPELPPPENEPPPPDQLPPRPFGETTLSANIAKMKASNAAIRQKASDPMASHASSPTTPPVATDPIQPAQQGPQQPADDKDPENDQGIEQKVDMVAAAEALLRLGRRQRFAIDSGDDAVDAGGNPPGKIPGPEFRRDDLVDDAPCGDIGQRASRP